MFLDHNTFRTVVEVAPLVSIDMLVENAQGEVLLGKRVNRPAKGLWFVPGGRVRKGETLDVAFRRLAHEELGLKVERREAYRLGVHEHFYDDSIFGAQTSTHYVVLVYYLMLDIPIIDLPQEQHNAYRWWSIDDVQHSDQVHLHTRAYADELALRAARGWVDG